jgi:hypothetical protein
VPADPTTAPVKRIVNDDGEALTNTDSSILWDADILEENMLADQGDDDAVEDDSNIFDSIDTETLTDGEMLSPTNLELIETVTLLASEAKNGMGNIDAFICEHLDDPPECIRDVFSSVLGDSFHQMKRPYIPIQHEYKKPYFVALMRAWFQWNEKKLDSYITILKENGWTDDDVAIKMYYQPRFFQELVERRVLPPRQLYWRVRAVYVKFGNRIDTKSRKPLFNKKAWKTANSVLKEILRGEASDPPNHTFYTQRLNTRGEPKTNKYGMQLINCHRGTNDVENTHKHIVSTFGTWTTGVETSCTLMSERRHRFNQRMSQKYRVGYPIIGHYNTWQVDLLQLLVESNHGVTLFPYWVNASDYKDTDESFDLVALQSTELHEAVNSIVLVDPSVLGKLSSELKFIAKGMGVQLPFLPVLAKEEKMLFVDLILKTTGGFDADAMALLWCKFVDGVTIFPKLPVYLREYHGIYLKNGRVKDAVKAMKGEVELLDAINKELVLPDLAKDNRETEEDSAATNLTGWPEVPLPSAMPRPERSALRLAGTGPPTVGGTVIGVVVEAMEQYRTKGKRKKDLKQRAKRRCRRCQQYGGQNAMECNGGKAGGKAACEHFNELGVSNQTH